LRFGRDQQFVHFLLTYFRYPWGANAWTGVAFGNSMRDGLDFIAVRILENRVLISDEFIRGFRPPWSDASQDVVIHSVTFIGGNLRVQFTRPLQSADIADFSLAGCLPWQFPTVLSPVGLDGHIHKHVVTPERTIVCIDRCPCVFNSTSNPCGL
uniref:DOMON domain-containing protein n=1 Tax=Gongylonema pulchrum TaxID=637853 RepID=A0A183E766_9BILA